MSTLKTHNIQSPDSSSVNIVVSPNAGIVVTGISTFNNDIKGDSATNISGISSVTATTYFGSGAGLTNIPAGNLTGTVADARITTLTASKLSGALPAISGANLTNLPASAPVGGATTNKVFFENDKLVEVNYQITSTKNAMTAGPVSVSAGIAVTVPSGCSWTIV